MIIIRAVTKIQAGAPNENIPVVLNHLNIALMKVF